MMESQELQLCGTGLSINILPILRAPPRMWEHDRPADNIHHRKDLVDLLRRYAFFMATLEPFRGALPLA